MNHVLGALGVAAGLLAAAPARALPTQTLYQASVGGAPAGTIAFDLDADLEGACRYAMEWGYARTPSERCFVDETSMPGFASCLFASLEPLASFVTLPPPGVPCQGIGGDGQSTPVSERSTASFSSTASPPTSPPSRLHLSRMAYSPSGRA
jgi:hypothetical protein